MDSEELRLLKENNILLKQIYQALVTQDNAVREFAINLIANLVSEGTIRH